MPKAEGFISMAPVNFDELGENLGHVREYMLVALNEALRKCGRILTPEIKERTPVGATKKLRNSTVFQVTGRAEDMAMEVRQSAFSDAGFPYGVAVRTGTKPHFPPVQALVPWVIAKLHVDPSRAHQVAFLVARKISKVGTKPQPYHVEALEAKQGEIVEVLKQSYIDFIARVGDVPAAGV